MTYNYYDKSKQINIRDIVPENSHLKYILAAPLVTLLVFSVTHR